MIATDPLVTVWDGLENHDCAPRGSLHQFVARCPGHEDRSASLSIGTGADGRALLWCFAGCPVENIVAAIGLSMADLYPPGHRNGRRIPGVAKPVPMLDLVLSSLNRLSIDYRASLAPGLWVAECCPSCQRASRWPLWVTEDDRRRVALSCAGGCDQVAILDALAVIR
jgi:hypothetical protein